MIKFEEINRFNSKWTPSGKCHIWKGALDRDGYGSYYFRKKNRRAHRVAYYLTNGDIPIGMVVDHICKNRNCVNASHLRLFTPRENTLLNSNSLGYKNSIKTHCIHGHPLDKQYGNQRYCSVCMRDKQRRLHKKWRKEANKTLC